MTKVGHDVRVYSKDVTSVQSDGAVPVSERVRCAVQCCRLGSWSNLCSIVHSRVSLRVRVQHQQSTDGGRTRSTATGSSVDGASPPAFPPCVPVLRSSRVHVPGRALPKLPRPGASSPSMRSSVFRSDPNCMFCIVYVLLCTAHVITSQRPSCPSTYLFNLPCTYESAWTLPDATYMHTVWATQYICVMSCASTLRQDGQSDPASQYRHTLALPISWSLPVLQPYYNSQHTATRKTKLPDRGAPRHATVASSSACGMHPWSR